MPAYFDPSLIDQLTGYLIIDTNVLHSCFTDPKFFVDFMVITKNTQLLIDPIVRLEFMRGAYQENLYAEKRAFLEYDKFYIMTDHYQMYKDLYDRALSISRIYSHHGKPDLKLGDLFIIARMAIYKSRVILATMDKDDFGTLLFNRIGIATFTREKKDKHVQKDIIEVNQFLRFDQKQCDECFGRLPKR